MFLLIGVIIVNNFNALLAVTSFFNVLQSLLLFLTFLKLRMSMPHLPRPFKAVRINRTIEILLVSLPLMTGSTVAYLTFFQSTISMCLIMGGLALGFLAYFAMLKCSLTTKQSFSSGSEMLLDPEIEVEPDL